MKRKLTPGGTGDDEFQNQYNHGLPAHEEEMRQRKRGRKDGSTISVKVRALESQTYEKRKCVGVFWPKQIYAKLIGKMIPRKRRHVEDGVAGIILPSDFYKEGRIPDGCTQLFDLQQKSVQKVADLGDSRNDIVAGQTAEVYNEAKKEVTLRSIQSQSPCHSQSQAPSHSQSQSQSPSHTTSQPQSPPLTQS